MSYRPHRLITISEALYSGVGVAQTVDLVTLAEDEYIDGLAAKIVANFAGAPITTALLELGVTGTLGAFGVAVDVSVIGGAPPRALWQSAMERGVAFTTGRHPGYGTPGGGPWVVKATLTVAGVGAQLDHLTAGSVLLSFFTERTRLA